MATISEQKETLAREHLLNALRHRVSLLTRGFQEHYQQLAPRLDTHIRVRLPNYAGAAAEDVAQRVWQKVWQSYGLSPGRGGYNRDIAGFYTYILNRYAVYEIAEALRKLGKEAHIQPLDNPDDDGKALEVPDTNRSNQPDYPAKLQEELQQRMNGFVALHALIFQCGGYPHQQLATAFAKFVYGSSERSNAAQVAKELGRETLQRLADDYDSRVPSVFPAGSAASNLHLHLVPLQKRLRLSVAAITRLDAASADQFRHLAESCAADTTFEEYHAGMKSTLAVCIAEWCDKVKSRVQRIVQGGKASDHLAGTPDPVPELICNRCILRHLPPCLAQNPEK